MDAKGRKEDVKAAARKSRRTDKENMNKNKQGQGGGEEGARTDPGLEHPGSNTPRVQHQERKPGTGTSGEGADWSVRSSIKGRRRRRHEEKARRARTRARRGGERPQRPGRGCSRGQGWRKGGRGEGQRQDAEAETQETEQGGGEKEKGEAVGKGVS